MWLSLVDVLDCLGDVSEAYQDQLHVEGTANRQALDCVDMETEKSSIQAVGESHDQVGVRAVMKGRSWQRWQGQTRLLYLVYQLYLCYATSADLVVATLGLWHGAAFGNVSIFDFLSTDLLELGPARVSEGLNHPIAWPLLCASSQGRLPLVTCMVSILMTRAAGYVLSS